MNLLESTSNITVKDIDIPIIKLGLINKNFLIVYENRKMLQFKYITLFIWYSFNILRFFLLITFYESKIFYKYLFDFIQYMGGLTIYLYIASLIVIIICIRILYIFHNESHLNLNWIQLLNAIKQNDSNFPLNKKFVDKIRLYYNIIQVIIKLIYLANILICVFIVIMYEFDKLLIISSVIYLIMIYYGAPILYFTLFYFYIICSYCKIRTKMINTKFSHTMTKLMKYKIFTKYKFIDKIFKEYNDIYCLIYSYNKFWKKIYFTFVFGLIPFNLLELYQVLFSKLPFLTLIMITIVTLASLVFQVLLNQLTASVSKEALYSFKVINGIYINSILIINLKRKIKVICSITNLYITLIF